MASYWLLGKEYRDIAHEVDELNDELLRRRERLRAPRLSSAGRQRSEPNFDHLGDAVSSLLDLEAMLKQRMDALNAKRAEAERILDTLPIRERRLLRLRYFHDNSWQQIAFKLHYDESTCRRLHRQLLRTKLQPQDSDDGTKK